MMFLQLDALPFGSPKQRTEARWLASQLRFQLAADRLDSEKERVVDFAMAEQEEARRLIELVSKSTVDLPEVISAAQQWMADNPAPEAEGEDAEEQAEPDQAEAVVAE